MLTHPTHDRLVALGLTGMAKALEEQRQQPDIAADLSPKIHPPMSRVLASFEA